MAVAMHFYGLIYAWLTRDAPDAYSDLFRARARAFAEPFRHWFADEGEAMIQGRSLTYRFATAGFYALAVVGERTAAYMAGGGCTLPGSATVLMPGQGYEGVTDFVFEVISSRGVNACPPLLVGVGVDRRRNRSTSFQEALMRPVGLASQQ